MSDAERNEQIAKDISIVFSRYELPDRILGRWAIILIVLTFAALLVIAAPPIQNKIACSASIYAMTPHAKDEWRAWLDWVTLLFQILIFLMLGGVAFTEPIAAKLRQRVENIVTGESAKSTTAQQNLKLALEHQIIRLLELRDEFEAKKARRELTLPALWSLIDRTYRATREMYYLASQDFPKHLFIFLTLRFISNWQGSVSGFLAFMLFLPWAFAPVMKAFFNYPINCH